MSKLIDHAFQTKGFQSTFWIKIRRLSTFVCNFFDDLISSGIVRYFEKEEWTGGRQPAKNEETEAQPLTMDHLGVCFAAILIFLGLSCVAFLIECLTKSFAKN
jgi:hypothetical protein